ncbi:unnamed protein product [Brassica oleracea]|uniref:Uncharacterized protein n=2 Tax=Brassica TaxID=3705 RepID=A0A3P6DXD7_BRAOL|nr:unnamed protein product [Brassica napus]VDD27734.1 unnamed protein product [Brassica oleracea]
MNALASAVAGHSVEVLQGAIAIIPPSFRPLKLGGVLHLTISPCTNLEKHMTCF